MDLYIDPASNDLSLSDSGAARLTALEEELVRQRLWISLSTYRGEWFANINFGVPYLDRDSSGEGLSILGGKNLNLLDFELQRSILDTTGVVQLLGYASGFDRRQREVTVSFSVETISGEIVTVAQVF